MAVTGTACIIDLYHKDAVQDWAKVKGDGIVAVIHKATEALDFHDKTYPTRRADARAQGLLWGSYHYAGPGDGTTQADYYLDYAKPAADEVMCLDVEPSTQPEKGPRVADMTFDAVVAFVTRVNEKTGRLPFIYGGRPFLFDMMAGRPPSIVTQCLLWYAEYPASTHDHPQHSLPNGWKSWTIWQYAADGSGPAPRTVDGAVCDRDTFQGTADDVKKQWPFTRKFSLPKAP